jgi:hypothetical protein
MDDELVHGGIISPTTNMAWSVNFRDDSDSVLLGMSQDLSDIIFTVDFLWGISTHLGDLRESLELKWEALVISDVPVHDIHLVVLHGIKCPKNYRLWQEVSCCVDHQTSVVVIWRIFNLKWDIFDIESILSISFDELRNCF